MANPNLLKRIQSPALDKLLGYLEAAGPAFIIGNLELWLDAAHFEILDQPVTEDDVMSAAYPDGYNEIKTKEECSLDSMMAHVNRVLTISSKHPDPQYLGVAVLLERKLREGYWTHVCDCFDYRSARIINCGWDIPYVTMGDGFAYVLYAENKPECFVLVGNISD